MKIDALGFVEARGLVTAIVAADAMVKAANVKLIRQHQLDPRFITLVVEGDLAACRAAVDAGVAAASRVGEVVSRLEIGRPDDDTDRMVLDLIDRSKEQNLPARKPAATTASSSPSSAAGTVREEKTVPVESAAQPQAAVAETSSMKQTQATLPTQELIRFVAEKPKGRAWSEIVKRFPQYDGHKDQLDEMVDNGQLRKAGNRYLAPSE